MPGSSDNIAIVLDFDDTLADDATSGLLASLGVDADEFWAHTVNPLLENGWDPIPAYLHKLIELSDSRPVGERITRDVLETWGRSIDFYAGVESLFATLRHEARAVDPKLNVEFYVISSGIGDVLRATSIAGEFTDIWACDFHYDESGSIAFPKNIVSFTEKTKFIYKISKGQIGPAARNRPFDVNDRTRDFRVPISQMIFIGDGHTDVPCFALVRKHEGVPIGVYHPTQRDKWGRKFNLVEDRRVSSLFSANFTSGSDLHNFLTMSVRTIAQRITTGTPAMSR